MRDMTKLIEAYINSKSEAWSPVTQSTEGYRLRGLTIPLLTDPKKLWDYLTLERKLKPYAARTTLIRAGEFLQFLMDAGEVSTVSNVIKKWMATNQRKVKHAYVKRPVELSFNTVHAKIMEIEHEEARRGAIKLLATAMRIAELYNVDARGQVVGKGGAVRTIPLADQYPFDKTKISRQMLQYYLRQKGLTPHMIRKVSLTKHAENGASMADLIAIAGWNSSAPADIYLQAQKTKSLANRLQQQLNSVKTRRKNKKNGK